MQYGINNSIKRQNLIIGCVLLLITASCLINYLSNRTYASDEHFGIENKSTKIKDKINPNQARWTSLARLPGIGEKLAQEIVRYRKTYQDKNQKKCFNQIEDLEKVRGIGPITCQRINLYLTFKDI